MCMGGECALKTSCYRFLAEAEETDQTYFIDPPFSEEEGVVSCKFYWEIESKDSWRNSKDANH